MEHRYLGSTGLKVSELCLGAMTFGRESDEAVSHAILDRFAAAGGTFIDTANVYAQGASEEIVGRWLRQKPRDHFVIATKVRFATGAGPNQVGLSRKHILDAVEASLRRLQTSYIDLYQVHCWDAGTPLDETLRTLHQLVERGWVRYLGASNYTGWQLQKAVDISRQHGWEGFSCLQAQYSLLCRSTEWDLMPVCQSEGLGLLPWSPLRGGWLSGVFRRGMAGPPVGSRIARAEDNGWGERWSAYAHEHTWTVLDTLHAVAKETGRTPAQVALSWVLHQPGVTAPIMGVRTLAHLEDNLGAAGWRLADAHRQALDAASRLALPYPHDSIALEGGGR